MICSVALALTVSGPAAAQSIVDQITDGTEWTMQMDNGRSGRLTLNPDGTGQMRFGFLRRSVSWTGQDSELCLIGTPDGDRCMTWKPDGTGFVAAPEEGKALRLVR